MLLFILLALKRADMSKAAKNVTKPNMYKSFTVQSTQSNTLTRAQREPYY